MAVKTLHTVSAVVEVGAGLALLMFPSMAATMLVGAALDTPAAITVARVCGAGLLSLGVACWQARRDIHSIASRGLVTALMLYDVAAAGILAFAGIVYGMYGIALWPAVVLHAAMATWCVACLRQGPR